MHFEFVGAKIMISSLRFHPNFRWRIAGSLDDIVGPA